MENQDFNISDNKGDLIGAGAKGVVAREIHGNVINLYVNSQDMTERLNQVGKMPTEVKQNQAAGMQGSQTSDHPEQLLESINELLELVKSSNRGGGKINEVKSGDFHISQVELLLKKAILIKSEADQMYFDQMAKNKHKDAGTYQVNLSKMLAGFDQKAHDTKLQEAYDLLDEANKLEPANTEVLLHMAQLLIELTPDDPNDEERLLRRIQNLLTAPKDDAERFRLAQATFLLATSGDQIHHQSLQDARAMFQKLGRNEWVRQCDDLLASVPGNHNDQQHQQTHQPHQTHPGQQTQQQPGFQPLGRWNIQVSDFMGSTMILNLHHNGYFDATQQTAMYGVIAQASGQWAYNPHQQMLQLQGMVNGFQPIMLGISIYNQYGNTYYGIGTDGYNYNFQKG
jgi:hypothetical protein